MFPSKYAVETKEEMIIRHRAEGRSEQEIAFFQAENQKEYESILNDPNTPEKVISMIVDGITLTHLKILAILHPNINIRSIKYILEKADKKGNQKDLIKAFLNSSKLDLSSWYDMRKYYNVARRFDIYVLEILKEESFSAVVLLVMLIGTNYEKKDKYSVMLIETIAQHKNMTAEYLNIWLDRLESSVLNEPKIIEIIKHNNHISTANLIKLYEKTKNEEYLTKEAKDIFLF
jgi:hypothetical protein